MSQSSMSLRMEMRWLHVAYKMSCQLAWRHRGNPIQHICLRYSYIMKALFSPMMFSGENAARRTGNRRLFAEDVKTRCQMVYTSVHMLHDSDETAIARRMPDVIQTTLDCYSGSCANCRRHAIVCRGGRRNWWNTSPHLKTCGLTRVNMTAGDQNTFQGLIEMRLGNIAIQMTRRRHTTNPNESANRAFTASLPKNIKFSRNALGRVCSGIYRLNYGARICQTAG